MLPTEGEIAMMTKIGTALLVAMLPCGVDDGSSGCSRQGDDRRRERSRPDGPHDLQERAATHAHRLLSERLESRRQTARVGHSPLQYSGAARAISIAGHGDHRAATRIGEPRAAAGCKSGGDRGHAQTAPSVGRREECDPISCGNAPRNSASTRSGSSPPERPAAATLRS